MSLLVVMAWARPEDEREGGALLFFNLDAPLAIADAAREYPSSAEFLAEARAHRPRGDDDDLAEDLFGQVPVLAGAPPADVTRREGAGDENPRIRDDADPPGGAERHQNIQASSRALDPTLCAPVGEQACGRGRVDRENPRGVADGYGPAGTTVQAFEPTAVCGRNA